MHKKILVIQTAFIGDALLTIPLLKRLNSQYSDHKITLLCRKGLGEFFMHFNLVDTFVEYDKSKKSTWKMISSQLSKQDYEVIISPHQSFRSQRLVFKLKSKIKIGYKKWWNSIVFNESLDRPMQLPEALRMLALLRFIDPEIKQTFEDTELMKSLKNLNELNTVSFLDQTKVPDWASATIPENKFDNDLQRTVYKKLKSTSDYVCLSPGSVWETKKWTKTGFRNLTEMLIREGHDIVFIGGPDEKEICSDISKGLGCINLAGELKLHESAYILKGAKALVCNDSGAAHLAATVGTPTVCVFGPTVLSLGYRPWNSKSAVVQTSLDCRPCGLHGSNECPIGTHECMKSITALAVKQQLDRLL